VRRRSVTAAAGAAAVLIVAGVAVALARGGGDGAGASTGADDTATATVERRDLVVRESFDGTLGYDDARPLVATAGGGTVTRLPTEGSIVERGGVLYAVNGRGVRLLEGSEPLYRRLATGVPDGADVRQLEQNLVAMGYDPDGDIDVDAHFDSATRDAVKRWQDAIGVAETGVVDVGDAVFLPGKRRVGSVTATVGAVFQPGTEVLQTTSTRAVVTVDLDARRQDLVHEGDEVQVELPAGDVVPGQITNVGTVAETDPASEDQGEDSTPTITVTISIAGVKGLDGAPVDVRLATARANDVLAVPVEALLALRGGGYALEVERGDGTTSLVAVKTGTFANGWVEVEGAGLRDGTKVVTPA
jgi:peptidoglycan hydrolase-like protein with peptidoglycan-binding domain